jgi:rubrerythrin
MTILPGQGIIEGFFQNTGEPPRDGGDVLISKSIAREVTAMKQSEFRKIISEAIGNEIEANTYYRSVSEKVKDKTLKDLFRELAQDEEKHKLTLEALQKKMPEQLHFAESKDYKVTDELPTPPLTPDLKPIDGLVIAIKKELGAMQMYAQLAKASAEGAQKDLFLELAAMERGHKTRLEDMYTNMQFPEAW